MSNSGDRLERRAQQLASQGADKIRVQALELAGRFKRSWLDMGSILQQIQKQNAFEAWGYNDIYAYCTEELFIKRGTVDKLIVSFATLERHAPEVLERDGVEEQIPAYDTVEYFGRVLDEEREPEDGDPEALTQLRAAIFEEGKPMAAIRKEFNPVFFSKSDEEQDLDALERASASTKRLLNLISRVNGLSASRVKVLCSELEALQEELLALIPKARKSAGVEEETKKAS